MLHGGFCAELPEQQLMFLPPMKSVCVHEPPPHTSRPLETPSIHGPGVSARRV